MQLTFNIPDNKKDLFIDAWGEGWMPEVDGQPNPQTKPQFAKEQIKSVLQERVKFHESNQIPKIDIT